MLAFNGVGKDIYRCWYVYDVDVFVYQTNEIAVLCTRMYIYIVWNETSSDAFEAKKFHCPFVRGDLFWHHPFSFSPFTTGLSNKPRVRHSPKHVGDSSRELHIKSDHHTISRLDKTGRRMHSFLVAASDTIPLRLEWRFNTQLATTLLAPSQHLLTLMSITRTRHTVYIHSRMCPLTPIQEGTQNKGLRRNQFEPELIHSTRGHSDPLPQSSIPTMLSYK